MTGELKADVSRIAKSLADMIVEWVDAGSGEHGDWRFGLAAIIELRLGRFIGPSEEINALLAARDELARNGVEQQKTAIRLQQEVMDRRCDLNKLIEEVAATARVLDDFMLVPPDGGAVKLHEGAQAMKDALLKAKEALDRALPILKADHDVYVTVYSHIPAFKEQIDERAKLLTDIEEALK